MTITPIRINEPTEGTACNTDKSCATSPDSTCGCGPTASATTATSRRGAKAALLGVACAAACLAVPLAAGGAAAVSDAIAGEWSLVAIVLAVTAVVGTVMVRRRGRGC